MHYENYRTQSNVNEYEYSTVNTINQFVPLYEEYYYSAGWSQGVREASNPINNMTKDTAVTLNFRRSRHWTRNRELAQLQDNCEIIISNIIELKSQSNPGPILLSIASGFAGATIFALTSSYILGFIKYLPPIFIAIPILLSISCIIYLSIIPGSVHKKLQRKAFKRIKPLLEIEYSNFDRCCAEIRRIVKPEENETMTK